MTLHEIEKLAEEYARQRDSLSHIAQNLQAELQEIKQRYLDVIRHTVRHVAEAESKLRQEIENAPELFKRPKTQIFHGVKVGYGKRKGKVIIDDEQAVIERIRKQLPKDQAELLIRVRESVDKNAIGDLTVADLKRLGIRVTEDDDAVVIKPVDGEVDKFINALVGEIEQIENEEAA